MGFLDRFKSKKKEELVVAAPPVMHKVTVTMPSYFKAGNGEYHFFIDNEENIVKPFAKIEKEVTEGTHVLRVFSTPETLGDVSEEFVIDKDAVFTVTVNVRDKSISINLNDKLRSHKEFEKEFKEKNGIKNR